MSSKKIVKDENSDFVNRFIEICGSSQPAQVAQLLNISYQGAKNYLEGRLPDSYTLIAISEKTGCSIDWLLTGKGKKNIQGSLKEDTPILSDQTKALIREECRQVVGEILSQYQKTAQGKVIVLKSEDIKEEKKLVEADTLAKKT